jgi:hypothetical protein
LLGAKLLWLCAAASSVPEDFGYSLDLYWYIWMRIPWIEEIAGQVGLADGPLFSMRTCACFIADLLAQTRPFQTRDIDAIQVASTSDLPPAAALSSDAEALSAITDPDRRLPRADPTRPWHLYFGLGVGQGNRWFLFQKLGSKWRYHHEIKLAGNQARYLLKAFLEEKGVLEPSRAFIAIVKPDLSRIPAEEYVRMFSQKVMGLVRPAMTRLRKQIVNAARRGATADVVKWIDTHQCYALMMPIGYAIDRLAGPRAGDEEAAGGRDVNLDLGGLDLELVDHNRGFEMLGYRQPGH